MPRALTESERLAQRVRLLEKGKAAVIEKGVGNVSVADIATAAGLAKGTFYHHFASKEAYLVELIWAVHERLFAQARQLIREANNLAELESTVRGFLDRLYESPELSLFLKDAHDIAHLLAALPDGGAQDFTAMEAAEYSSLLELAGVDTAIVRPGVVHNYLHAMYLMRTSDLMVSDLVPDTYQRMVDGLMAYLFLGLRRDMAPDAWRRRPDDRPAEPTPQETP